MNLPSKMAGDEAVSGAPTWRPDPTCLVDNMTGRRNLNSSVEVKETGGLETKICSSQLREQKEGILARDDALGKPFLLNGLCLMPD